MRNGTGGRLPAGDVPDPMQDLKPTVWIGKLGCTETIIGEIASQLEHRRQVKVKWLRNTEISPADVANRAGATLVGVRGRTMVLSGKKPPGKGA